MSALVCGKRCYFEELPTIVTKRLRCSSISSNRLSPPTNYNPFVQSAEGYFKSATITTDLQSQEDFKSATITTDLQSQEEINGGGGGGGGGVASCASNLPKNGAEWVHLFVNEMSTATDMDNARTRAARVLEVLEKSIRTQANAEAADSMQKENVMLKEQMEVLMRENGILKRAVTIQHERQKEADNKNHELQHIKQPVTEYQERLKTLEVNNYALTMHLRQAQQSSSIPGRFHPDVF